MHFSELGLVLRSAVAIDLKLHLRNQGCVAVGYSDWWKLQALFYMLRHPRPSYRTRDLRAHLAQHGLKIGTKDIRRFCTRHAISRDMRAGRPRTRA